MKKSRKILIINIIFIIVMLLNIQSALASSLPNEIKQVEYTEEFKKYLELTEEERKSTIQPRMYEVIKTKTEAKNPLLYTRKLRSSLLSKYDLREYIPENIVIKNQGKTNTCWAFSSLATLETNLALTNYNKGKKAKVYDFSERHMEYATSREFKDEKINKAGFNRKVGSAGNFYISTVYLTNGTGPIAETDMTFEDNENIIDINEIQNKEVISQVYDTIAFPSYSVTEDITEIKQQMKEHIKTYGAIQASVHGASVIASEYCNNDTGAIYCDDKEKCPLNHGVVIIGWDDNYNKENFNEEHRPKNNGAWIVKNSWGTKLEYKLSEFKEELFNQYKEQFTEKGWTDATLIPDEFITLMGFTIEGDKAIYNVGDKGFMYISYEDVNIYSELFGIIKATDSVDYDNIYQYNYLGMSNQILCNKSKVYLANVFEKKTEEKEYLKQLSIYATEAYTCKVYVNPNGESKKKEDLQQIELEAGSSETFGTGYHTLEFLNPIEIKADKFAVVIEIQGTRENELTLALEANIKDTMYDVVEIENNKCFYTVEEGFTSNEWQDLSKLSEVNSSMLNSDSTIKAFTVSNVISTLKDIKITKQPNKTTYEVGEDFDKEGMQVTANYNDGTSKVITDYEITNGTNLTEEQTSVTIEYDGKTTTQGITVKTKTDDNENNENIEPENSNFNNITAKVINMKAYLFRKDENKNYITFDIEIRNIERSKKNDNYEYYYYLSSSQAEENIENWVKIKEEQKQDDKLSFTINTQDISNMEELESEDVLYLYIKEVAIKGEKQKVSISKAMLLEDTENLQLFVDNEKFEFSMGNAQQGNSGNSSNISNNSNNKGNVSNNKDNTIVSGKLPAAGKTIIIIVSILAFTIIGTVMYVRYKTIDK